MKYYKEADTGDKDNDIAYAYRQANRKVFGAEYALSVYDKDVYAKAETLKGKDIPYDDFYDVYFEDYKPLNADDTKDGSEKSVAFIGKLIDRGYDDDKINAFASTLKFYQAFAVKTALERYNKMIASGCSSEDAKEVLSDIDGLEPQAGKDEVSFVQKLRAIADSSLDDAGKLAAVNATLDKTTKQKVNQASEYGVNVNTYTEFQEILPKYDADGNGSYKHAEVEAALDSMNLSNTERAVLWQLRTGGKHNPYDRAIGANIKAEAAADKQAAKAASEKSLLTDLFGAAATSPLQSSKKAQSKKGGGSTTAEDIQKIMFG